MDHKEFESLEVGDIVRHAEGSDGYVVTGNYGDRVTAVRTVDLTNPSEWIRVRCAGASDPVGSVRGDNWWNTASDKQKNLFHNLISARDKLVRKYGIVDSLGEPLLDDRPHGSFVRFANEKMELNYIEEVGKLNREYDCKKRELDKKARDAKSVPKFPDPPKPPLCRLIKEGYTLPLCPKCGSSQKRSFPLFGKIIGCIQPGCDNYFARREG